ncbi:MAG: ABC transporter permease [Acidobacteria bacterium]|nr:ABC transporter permease [Acidobacteriota bacterium]
MNFRDILRLGLQNMQRRALRFFLTTFGVTIGVGMLVIMMSVGVGIQRNTVGRLESTDLFTSLTVFSDVFSRRGGPIFGPSRRSPMPPAGDAQKERPALDDAVLAQMSALAGVRYVYPQRNFTAQLKRDKTSFETMITILPAPIVREPVYAQSLEAGAFFASDAEDSIVLSEFVAQRLGLPAGAAAVGQTVSLLTLASMPGLSPEGLSFQQKETIVRVAGLFSPRRSGVSAGLSGLGFSGVIVSSGLADRVGGFQLSLNSLFGMLSGKKNYGLATVRVHTPRDLSAVRKEIEKLGFTTFAISDALGRLKIVLVILDSILGIIGSIALVVSLLGIVNTMLMSILERTREIGIMKAIGAEDWDIQKIFFLEAGLIGFIGGWAGVGLGWTGSRLVNWIVNRLIVQQGGDPTQVLATPWWLVLGAMVFSIVVSLLAGIYPARRAARIDPVIALRHD